MATSGCGEASAVQGIAVELFQLASLLVGDEAKALELIEHSIATMEIDPCIDPEAARTQARTRVTREALTRLVAAEPAMFAHGVQPALAHSPCIQDDDLQAAGLTPAELRSWIESQGKPELRKWLEGLPVAQRAIFVQRAVLGQGNEAAASLLREAGGAHGWTAEGVSGVFRQALCSLANLLVHAPGVEAVPA